jgi:hypothetical protein
MVSAHEHIVCVKTTLGTETSKYREEKKERFDSLSSGERKGNSPNTHLAHRPRGSLWNEAPQGVRAPYPKGRSVSVKE